MSPDSSRPVFIIGGSRTGSTMLQTILSKSPDLDITDELLYFSPWWIRRDLVADINTHVGPLDAPGALDKLIDLLYSGVPLGWFWSASERLLDRDMLQQELSDCALNTRTIFNAILSVHARMRNKRRIGAKFPMHYSCTSKLLEWYPDCLLIHTTRNPKAVFASQAAKYVTPDRSSVSKSLMRFRQFVHINIQTTWTARLHQQLRDLPNYRLIRYEDLVLEPEKHIRQLCEYLGISFQSDMLQPRQFGSSFQGIGDGNKGIDTSSIDRWRATISPATAKAFDVSHRKAYNILGYRRIDSSAS